jgi:flavin-dependent dehydrogenase
VRALGVACDGESAPYRGLADRRHVRVFPESTTGRHVLRSWLDPALREAAAAAGVSCRVGVDVREAAADGEGARLVTSQGELHVRYVVDASGRRNVLARQKRLARPTLSPPLIAWRGIVADETSAGGVARFTPHDDGWTFVAPVAPARAVCTRLRAAGVPAPPFGGARAHAATWRLVRPLAGPGWFIAGEAAGALDPAWGAGIAFALHCGAAAGAAVVASLRTRALAPVIAARYDDVVLGALRSAAATLAATYDRLGIGVLRRN